MGTKTNKKKKAGKLPWRLFFPMFRSLEACVRVLDYGRQEGYTDFGWLLRSPEDHDEALMRHMSAYVQGERFDKSGESHLAHIALNALMALELREDYYGEREDRKRGTVRSGRDTLQSVQPEADTAPQAKQDGVQLREASLPFARETPTQKELEECRTSRPKDGSPGRSKPQYRGDYW